MPKKVDTLLNSLRESPPDSFYTNDYSERFQSITEHSTWEPTFCFKHISWVGSQYCWNNGKIPIEHFKQFFNLVRKISNLKMSQILSASGNDFHFHHIIDYWSSSKPTMKRLKSYVEKTLSIKTNSKFIESKYPTIYQIGLFPKTDRKIGSHNAPRLFFFINRENCLNLLYFDIEHKIFPVREFQRT